MTTHTPNTWKCGESIPFVYALNEAGTNRFFASIQGGYADSHRGGERTSDDELLANARLIAAAPDLLAALREMVDAWEHGCKFEANEIGFARAAIAKAEGK